MATAPKRKKAKRKKAKAPAAPAVPMADRLELWPLGKLTRYKGNPRTHTAEGIRAIAASISQFGFRSPILVDAETGTIVAGHGRLSAAELLGLAEVPVVPLDGMTEDQRRGFVIADNQLVSLSDWEPTLLAEAAEGLDDETLAALGFTDDELAKIQGAAEDGLGGAGLLPPEESPELGLGAALFGAHSSMTRSSAPINYWRAAGYLEKGEILDFGCGKDDHGYSRWDPFTHPDPAPLLRTWDVVLCTYVLNVQPADHLVTLTAALVARLVRTKGGVALFAIRNDLDLGVARSARGVQVGKAEPEWRALLAPFFPRLEPADTTKFHGYIGRRSK